MRKIWLLFLTRDEQQNYNNILKINRSMEQINETDYTMQIHSIR